MDPSNASSNEKPPGFQRWSRWYWLVIGVMVIQLVIYTLITFSFS